MLLLVLAMADTISRAVPPAPAAAPMMAAAAPVPQAAAPAAQTSETASPAPATAPDVTPGNPAAPVYSTAPAPSGPAATDATASAVPATPTSAPATTTDVAATNASATDASATDEVAEPRDPWIKANRAIFSFDTTIDRHLLGPVAHGYAHVVPKVVRFHITSALYNLGEPLTATNDLLQLRIGSMGKALLRFVINSTVGIAGLFDVAKASGIPIHISDFGQTLGRYGAKPGPYIMLPLLGPSDLRDGFGRLVDNFIDPVEFFIGGITSPEGLSLFLLEGVDWRSRSDETLKAVYSATDPYAFARSAYTQSRAAIVSEATGKQAELPDFDAPAGTP